MRGIDRVFGWFRRGRRREREELRSFAIRREALRLRSAIRDAEALLRELERDDPGATLRTWAEWYPERPDPLAPGSVGYDEIF